MNETAPTPNSLSFFSATTFNQVAISTTALRKNFIVLRQAIARHVQIMAMVKADAYGHGMVETARIVADVGCDCFGVAEIEEGVALRAAGVKGKIFVILGFQASQEQFFFDYDLTPVVFDDQSLKLLSNAAKRNDQILAVHIKIDCGMGRLGIIPTQVSEFIKKVESFPGLSLAGIMSHFPLADVVTSHHTLESFQLYQEICRQHGQRNPIVSHIANSGASLYFPLTCCDMVRLGISLYGYYPDGAQHTHAADTSLTEALTPVMSFTTRVVQVKSVPAGTGISYGHSFITNKETRIAVLPVGYANGFLRSLSNKAQVLIKGQRAPIIGRVCMNLCMADISDIDSVQSGDQVVILGTQDTETITADEIAGWMGTISYEVLCLFGNNNKRSYSS